MADTTEARRLADEADAVLAQLDDRTNQTWAGKRQRWATLIRSMLDERKRLTSAIEKYEADDVRYMVERKRLQEERDELRAQVEALRSHIECDGDALLRLVVDLRWALGDKGRRMQDDLVRHAGELRADAERFRALIDSAPGCLCFMGQDYRSADAFRAAIDAARSQEAAR